MNAETTIEKAKAAIEEMRKLLAKLEAEKATKPRNWPEWIEAGMVFRFGADRYLLCGPRLVNLVTGGVWCTDSDPFGGDEKDFTYEGKLDLTIRTDAHEPTGAELVGKMVNVKMFDGNWSPDIKCIGFNPGRGAYPYIVENSPSVFAEARLAK